MATVKELNLEDESQQGASSSEQLSTASTISPQTGANTGAAGANMAPTQTDSRKGSGRFMNLQKYLDANQGAGETLAGGITKSTQQESDQFQKQAQQKSNPISQNIQAEKDRLANAAQMNQQVQQGQAQQVAQNNLDDFTQVRMGQNNLADIQGMKDQYSQFAQQGLGQLGQTAEQAATEGGRFNLLRNAYGGDRPGSEYNLGQRRLDQLFLQAEGGGQLNQLQQSLQNQVGQARDQFGQQMNQFGQSVQNIDEGTRQAQEEAMAALGQWEQPGQGAFGNLYGQLQEGVQGRQSEMDAAVQRARQQLSQGRLDQSLAQELGISGPVNTYNLDLQNWANRIAAGDADVTMADVAQEDQINQLAALQQLAGVDPSEQFLGERGGTLLDRRFGQEFKDAAAQSGRTYDSDFYNQDFRELFNLEPGRAGLSYGIQDVIDDLYMGHRLGSQPGRARNSILSGMQQPTGKNRDALSQVSSDLQSSVDWLQSNIPNSGALPARTDYLNRFQQLLNMFDAGANRQLNITPDTSDQMLGSGGHFNIV